MNTAALALLASLAAAPDGACAHPDVPSAVVRAGVVDTPPIAAMQGIGGTVDVAVRLDEYGRLVGTSIVNSPSMMLNNEAIAAARRSSYRPEVRACHAVASVLRTSIMFNQVVHPNPAVDRSTTPPQIIIVSDGSRGFVPLTAVALEIGFTTRAVSAAAATAADDAGYAALAHRLDALGRHEPLTDLYYNVLPAQIPGAPNGTGIAASRGVGITVPPSADLTALVRAATESGATSVAVGFIGRHEEGDLAPIVAAAIQRARFEAQRFAEARGGKLGPLVGSETSVSPTRPVSVSLDGDVRVPSLPPDGVTTAVSVVVRFASIGQLASCARPNVPAMTVRAVDPGELPWSVERSGTVGTVLVRMTLDAQSHVIGAEVQSSPDRRLNQLALDAVRRSTFQTELRDCTPIRGDFLYSVDFPQRVEPAYADPKGLMAHVNGRGSVDVPAGGAAAGQRPPAAAVEAATRLALADAADGAATLVQPYGLRVDHVVASSTVSVTQNATSVVVIVRASYALAAK